MNSKIIFKSLVVIISMASVSQAYLTPGNGSDQPPPQYCENPHEPCDQHGNPIAVPGPLVPGPSQPPAPPLQPGYPNQPNPGYGYRQVKQVYIGRAILNERLLLNKLANLNPYRGWEVVSVRAQTRPNNPYLTVAQLVSGARVVAEQRNPGYEISLYPNSRVIVDSSAMGLQLVISGSTIIDTIEIELVNNGGGYNPNPGYGENERVEINLYRSTYGNDRIDLTSYINLQQHLGQRIESIEVQGRADYNVAIVEVLINGFQQGVIQFSGSYMQALTLFLPQRPMIGQGADSIVLNTRGNMTIETVILHLSQY